MAKINRRKSLETDISAEEFISGKTLAPGEGTAQSIEIGLSIEGIQDSTKNLTLFKKITEKQLMAVTENDEKRVSFLSHLHQWKEQSSWIAGRLLTAIQDNIEKDFNTWSSKGEKPEQKPEFTSFNQWIEVYSEQLGFGKRAAQDYMWIYKNVEFERASLGVKKQKLIKSVDDPVLREKLEQAAVNENLTVNAIKERIEKEQQKEVKKEETEKKLEQINFNVNEKDGKYIINCKNDDTAYIIQAIQKYEKQIKLYAQSLKEKTLEQEEVSEEITETDYNMSEEEYQVEE